MSTFHKLPIAEITRETPLAISISFTIPDNLKDAFKFKAGQYITLKATINGKEVRRAYSLCSTPHSSELKVAVKEVEDGTFSKYANRELKVGDVLEVMVPEGKFIFSPDASAKRNIAAFAAGSGITPIMSIAKTILEKEPNSTFVLVYGNKSEAETIFFKELSALKEQYGDRFFMHLSYSNEQSDDALFGRIEASTVNYAVKNKHKNLAFDAFYLCGPEAMIHIVTDTLKANGVAAGKIHFELFTASTTESEISTVIDGQTNITIMVDDEETSFVMDPKTSILQAALDRDIDAPYSCQGGVCSSCLARLTEGTAEMRQNNILTESEVAEGLILTCQAHPTSSIVKIDYDDV
jgi:ring-1,2-phenylacetyl-CoA epoxidase subunit PaaE